MLTDSLPKNATSSIEMSGQDERALKRINAPRGEERRRMLDMINPSRADANICHATSAHEAAGTPQIVRQPSDWKAGCRACLVHHAPTRMIFEIFARPDLNQDDMLTLEDFRARLVHGGEGTTPSTQADLQVLCGEAVLMALFLVGLAWPVAVNPN